MNLGKELVCHQLRHDIWISSVIPSLTSILYGAVIRNNKLSVVLVPSISYLFTEVHLLGQLVSSIIIFYVNFYLFYFVLSSNISFFFFFFFCAGFFLVLLSGFILSLN